MAGLAIALKKARKLAGLNQEQAAEAAGISQPEVVRLEKQGDMKLSTLRRYLGGIGFQLQVTAKRGDETLKIE